ncbi:hypothetical protein [Thalassobaculum sp.]|uniref:hypothetical protein n=1 Tax=Thalassobaculum sp. TaxID=2022740 RepID=UPI0032EE3DF6
MTVQRLVGAAALVQAMRRDGYGPTARDATGSGGLVRLFDDGGGFADAAGEPPSGRPEAALFAAAE